MRHSQSMMAAIGLGLLLLGPMSMSPATAQTEETTEEVKRLLTTLAPRHERGLPTTIIIQRPVELEIDTGTVIVDYGYTLDIEVQFEFDSARLTRDARRSLAALGRALQSEDLVDYDYLVAGHTDAKGSAAYNRALSYDRARAVRDYLIKTFGISPRRLHVIGWGESRLKTPRRPLAAENRRVEVTLILPAGIVLNPTRRNDPSLTIRITPAPGTTLPKEGADPMVEDTDTFEESSSLPPCPTSQPGDPRDPAANLDDFGPRPGIDCLPAGGATVRITPEGEVIIE
ncbi:OmpA family protein [Devosia sp.]|uniref:OmpA family protein n=1 Tax=Devosia sp. TaxID=1871048 RepID=UPI0037C06E22